MQLVPLFCTGRISRGLDIEILVSIIHEVQCRVIQGCTRKQILRGFCLVRERERGRDSGRGCLVKQYAVRVINGVYYGDLRKARYR